MAQNLKINILAKDKTKAALNGVRGRLAGLKNAVFSLKGAFVGLGAGLVIKSFVSTGRSIEDLNVRLKQLFGSTQEGAKAFDVMSKFAARVPFSLEQIQAASGNLAVVAGDADRLSKILEITGNVAAVTGIDFNVAAEQIQRSFAGGIAAADIFRERGVRDMLGFKAGATISAEETVKAFEKVFGKGGRFGGATKELSTTFTGTLSMLGDKLFNFKKNVAGAQFFDELKKEFKSLNIFIEENSEDFEAIANAIGKVLTVAVKAFAAAVRGVARAVGFLREQYNNLLKLFGKEITIVKEFKKAEHHATELNIQLTKSKTILEEVNEGIKKINKGFSISKEVVGLIKSGISSFSKALAETIVLGKELNKSMKELAQRIMVSILQKIIERIALLAVEKALQIALVSWEERKRQKIEEQNNALKKQLGLRAALGVSSFFGNFFGKQSGGAVSKGKPTIVGERGPELFVPNQTGQITQNARGAGGGSVNVNFSITTLDATGFSEMLAQNRGTITSIINNAMNEKGARGIV